ncbi:hypothetical protein HQ529_01245 [Candidatus Woesearchaeota archaeon]|nr:hypothetical protein [Candidatus Woesearchaeota archaeon]
MKKNKLNLNINWISLIIFIIITLIFVSPIFKNFEYWGVGDWDQHVFYNDVPRKTILEYNQFPLWNPYYCGGNAMLAHPESSFLSPFYIFILIFGAVGGLKILIVLHIITGMFGMFLLSRKVGIGKISSFLPPIIFMMSSWFPLRMNAGHSLYFGMVFLPYAFLFYLKSKENIKYIFISALFLLFIIFSGGTYPFIFSIIFLGFYALLETIKTKKTKPIEILAFIIIFTFLLGAIKFFPSIEFVDNYSFSRDDTQPTSFNILYNGLLSRNQNIDSRFYTANYEHPTAGEIKVEWYWHEYGAYVGIIPLILFITGFFLLRKKWVLLLTSLFLLFLSLGEITTFNLWRVLRALPVFSTLHGPSRFLMLFIFSLALVVGLVLTKIENLKKLKLRKYIVVGIIVIVLIDMILVSSPIFGNIFLLRPREIIREETDFLQVVSLSPEYLTYRNFNGNLGTLNCYDRLHPKIKASSIGMDNGTIFTDYTGESYIAETGEVTEITYFSPNKVIINAVVTEKSTLVLNQNYDNGWKTKNGDVVSYNGLIAKELGPGKNIVTFYYLPNTFIIGLITTLLVFIFGFYWYYKSK